MSSQNSSQKKSEKNPIDDKTSDNKTSDNKTKKKYYDNCCDYLKSHYINKYAWSTYRPMLSSIQTKIPQIDICDKTSRDSYNKMIIADQHAVVFTHGLDKYSIIGTYALNACVGLIIDCRKYKIVSLAHIDGLPGYSKQSAIDDGIRIGFDPVKENIEIILTTMRKMARTNGVLTLDYYLVGGIFDLSEIMINDIVNCLSQVDRTKYMVRFAGRNLLGPKNQTRNICIDSSTGKISHFDYLENILFNNISEENNLPVNIIKAPRFSEAFLDITYIAN